MAFLSHPSTWSPRFVLKSGNPNDTRCILGSGTYGQVVLVVDTTTQRDVAMKISRKEPAYRRSALTEVDVLQKLRNNAHVVKYIDHFQTQEGYVHTVVELMDINLYEHMRSVQFQVIPISIVRQQAEAVLRALAAMHSAGYMHCDIKPENIMVRDRRRPEDVCLIDFGSARKFHENKYYDVQSLWYRAPEVICGYPYTTAIDIWSVGCVLYEAHTGSPLFPGEDAQHSLSLMIALVKWPSVEVVQQGTLSRNLSFQPAQELDVAGSLDPSRLCSDDGTPPAVFTDLLRRMLHPDPVQRITAEEALRHKFFDRESDSMYLPNMSMDSSMLARDSVISPHDDMAATPMRIVTAAAAAVPIPFSLPICSN